MKLINYCGEQASWGVIVQGDRIVEGQTLLGGRFSDLKSMLAHTALPELRAEVERAHPTIGLGDVRPLPAVPNPGKIICVGLNYSSHVRETSSEAPSFPRIFIRLADTLVAHGGDLVRPKISNQFDFEGELALVVGKHGRHIREDEALNHVAGYCCFMDGSVRDFQKHSTAAGKNFFSTAGLGPAIVTADEIADPSLLTLVTRLNGAQVQHSPTSRMIHPIPRLISYISSITPLESGDVIGTGTPEGVGQNRSPQLWLTAGDRVEVEISEIGVLANQVVDEI